MGNKCIRKVWIKKTPSQLTAIENALQFLGKKSLESYLRSEIPKLVKKIDAEPVEEIIEIPHFMTSETHSDLIKLSEKLKKPATKIVDEFLLIPLQNKI